MTNIAIIITNISYNINTYDLLQSRSEIIRNKNVQFSLCKAPRTRLLKMRRLILTYSAKRNVKLTLRPLVHDVAKTLETPDVDIDEFQYLVNQNNPVVYRVVWFAVVLCCSCICCYQITDRVKALLTYPTAVDVEVSGNTELIETGFKMCSAQNEYVANSVGNLHYLDEAVYCDYVLLFILKYQYTDLLKIWAWDDVSDTYYGHEFSPDANINVSVTTEQSLFGHCTNIDLDGSLKLKNANNMFKIIMKNGTVCSPSMTMFSLKGKVEFPVLYTIQSGREYLMKIGFRKHRFLNTPAHPCVSDEEFKKCYRKCIRNRLKTETNCSLPFFPVTERELQVCDSNMSLDVYESYRKALKIILIPDINRKCGCKRACLDTQYIIETSSQSHLQNESVLTVNPDHVQMVLTERLAYKVSDLAADIGGNLSLFLGVSALSIVNLFFVGTTSVKNKFFTSRNLKKHFLRNVVTGEYKMVLQKQKKPNKLGDLKQEAKLPKCLKLGLIIFSLCILIFLIFDRISYYFTYPIRHDVKLKTMNRVTIPPTTICGISDCIFKLQQKYAKNNLVSKGPCVVDMFDMIEGNGPVSLDELWKKSPLKVFTNMVSFLSEKFGLPYPAANRTAISTNHANCVHFLLEETDYAGFFTTFPILIQSTFSNICPGSHFEVFYGDLGSDTYNILTRVVIPAPSTGHINFRLAMVKRLNSTHRPCIDHQEFRQCQKDCLVNQLKKQKSNLCRLPFVENILDLPNCTSAAMAKETRELYTDILAKVTVGGSCLCVRLCEENVITLSVYSQPLLPGSISDITLQMSSNNVQIVLEVGTYSLITLLCDIGNCLGLTIGISVLAAVKFSHYPLLIAKYIVSKIKSQ